MLLRLPRQIDTGKKKYIPTYQQKFHMYQNIDVN